MNTFARHCGMCVCLVGGLQPGCGSFFVEVVLGIAKLLRVVIANPKAHYAWRKNVYSPKCYCS